MNNNVYVGVRKSTRGQIRGLFIAAALFALFAWGSAHLLMNQERLRVLNEASQAIETVMGQSVVQFRKVLAEGQEAALLFASLPSIDGLGREMASGSNAPTSSEVWIERLEQVAAAYTASHSNILQIRLIGVTGNGREWVRVGRDAAGQVAISAKSDLQVKGDRPYFIEALRLPEGQIYVSPFELNIEHGQLELPVRPTLRAAMAVRNARGEVFAVVVVNLMAQPLLAAIGTSVLPDVQTYLTNAAGYYLYHPQFDKTFGHEREAQEHNWREDFTAAPGVLEASGFSPTTIGEALRAPDGAHQFVLTRILDKPDTAGMEGLTMHAAIPLAVLEARAWTLARPELLVIWGQGLIVLAFIAFIMLYQRGTPTESGARALDQGLGGMLHLPDLKTPPVLGGWTNWRFWGTLVTALLPLPFWFFSTLYLDQPVAYPYIKMLLPALLAAWWGGGIAGGIATIIATACAWNLATPPAGGGHMDFVALVTTLTTGLLFALTLHETRRRGKRLLAQQVMASDTEHKYRQLWESSRDALMLILAPRWTLNSSNAAAVALFGATDSEQLAKMTLAQLSPEVQPKGEPSATKLAQMIELALRDGSAFFEWKYRRQDNGRELCCEVLLTRIALNGQSNLQATVRDITPRKSEQEALRSSEEQYRAITETASSAIISANCDDRIIGWNAAAEVMFGYTVAEALDQPLHLIMPERYRAGHSAGFARHQQTGKHKLRWAAVELFGLRKGESEFPIELSLSRWYKDNESYFTATIQDTTERKAAEAAQNEANREKIDALEHMRELEALLQQNSEREKRRIGHDLHDGLGPHLAAIGYLASFLVADLRQGDSPSVAKAEQLTKMAGTAVSLARDLARGLCPVQLEEGGLSLALETLTQTMSTFNGVNINYAETGLSNYEEDVDWGLHLYRITQEALHNALNHGGAQNVTVALNFSADRLRMTIADDGAGFNESVSTPGMGLHSMKYRTNILGGDFGIESAPGQGTIVSCEIPLPH